MQNILKSLVNGNVKYNILIVGVGGVSLSRLALYLKNIGHNIIGVDSQKTSVTKNLENSGIEIVYKHLPENVKKAQVIIYSFAVTHQVEIKKAKELGIPVFSRAELLGEILKKYKTSICVAGAHGKTTTTALIYWVLNMAEYNVDLHLGGKLAMQNNLSTTLPSKNNIKSNQKQQNEIFDRCEQIAGNDLIVCEACEYKDAFLNFKPSISVVTNVAPEHLDYFKTYQNVKKSFNKFLKNSKTKICFSGAEVNCKQAITYGLKQGNFTIQNKTMLKDGTYKFKCLKNGKFYGNFKINLIGEHNVLNALACICVCDQLNININIIKKALSTFCGVRRRFEYLDKKRFIVHDYAHHPDEIKAVLAETKKFYKGKLLVVFQPHTYSRTKNFYNQFVNCLKDADSVAIYKTYSAREKYIKKGSAKALAEGINDAVFFKSKIKLKNYIQQKLKQNYGILILGAGNLPVNLNLDFLSYANYTGN